MGAEFPFAAAGPVLFGIVAYWIVGFVNTTEAFLTFLGTLVMINMTAVSFGMFIASIAPSVEAATAIAPLVVIVFLLFGGFYVNTANIPDFIAWVQEISFFKWGFKALAINEYQTLQFVGKTGQLCKTAVNVTKGDCAFEDGKQVLELLTFGTGTVAECLIYLFCITVVVHCIAFSCLQSKRSRFVRIQPISKALLEEAGDKNVEDDS